MKDLTLISMTLISKDLTLISYEKRHKYRDEAIQAAYNSGGYTLKALGEYFGLHYSMISRIVNRAK